MERNKLDAATIKGLKRYMALSGVRANIRRCWEKGSFAVHCVPIQWRQRTTKDNYAKKSSHGAMIRGSLLLIADRGYRHPFGRHFPRLKVRLAVIPGSEYLPAVAERIVVNFATSPENSVRTLHLVAAGSGPTSRIDLASLQSRLPKDVQVVVDHATKGGGPFTLPFSFPSPQAVENLLAIYWSNAKDLSKTDSAKSEALMNCGDIERAKVQFPHVEQLLLR
jgi:hypothetical protein